MELDKSDDVRKRRPKGDDVDYRPSSDDERWEKAKNKPGNESLEPRRISVPLPGSEAHQSLTPANRKMIKRLDDKWNFTSCTRNIITCHQLNFVDVDLC